MKNNPVNHLALIMDGNKRWSIKNSETLKNSYLSGLNNLQKVSRYCVENKIKYLTVYALSSENFFRPGIKTIFDIIKDKSKELGKNFFLNNNIKVNFIGQLNKLPKSTLIILKQIQNRKIKNNLLNLNIVINYDSYEEIISVYKLLLKDKIHEKNISYDLLRKYMYLGSIPDPDLLIRTGGYQRLSNFLLLYMNYTEFHFTSTLWPDLKKNELDAIINKFKKIKRNYGL